jgi:hypothetical protein
VDGGTMRRRIVGAVLLPLVLVAAGCGSGTADDVTTPAPAVTPVRVPTSASDSAPSGSSTGEAVPDATGKDDLATGRAHHTIRSSGVTATVDYETTKPGIPWTADGDKPLRVEVKVSRPSRKVYLNRVTLRFLSDDGTGDNPGPDPLVDTSSNITPGFLVAPPYSYVQAFAVPVVDPSTVTVTIDVKLELVSLVDAKARDYTKQTVTDRITTAIKQ